jgi:molecular chaperone GrpE
MGVQEGDKGQDADGGFTPPPVNSEAESPVANRSGPAEAETVKGSNVQPPPAAEAGGAADPIQPPHGFTDPSIDSAAVAEAVAAADVDRLAEAEAKRDEYLDLARRTQADFENFRKRADRERSQVRDRAIAEVVRELLPAIDNLERAIASIEESATAENAQLGEGVKLVHGELHGVLERLGLTALDPAGDQFDPNVHDAIATRPQDGTESGVVLDVAQKGYLLGEHVVRPARVVVSS